MKKDILYEVYRIQDLIGIQKTILKVTIFIPGKGSYYSRCLNNLLLPLFNRSIDLVHETASCSTSVCLSPATTSSFTPSFATQVSRNDIYLGLTTAEAATTTSTATAC